MTDRELLEAAAKAAGITLRWIQGPNDDECIHPIRRRDDGMCEVDWNPLTNDGDALRLAVKLGLFMRAAVREIPRDEYDAEPYAATRRAITRAAAAIGEVKK